MSKIQEKWRDSLIDVENIKFKNIKIDKIISYPPAGNDVFECIGLYKNKKINFIVKSERGKFADFANEIKVLPTIKKYFPVPTILETEKINDHVIIVLSKIEGDKLSDIFKENPEVSKSKYLFNYGKALGQIHKLKINWKQAKLRDINDYPKTSVYKDLNEWELNIINYLKNTKPKCILYNTFIHGDFHYGNILWENYKITGILDWEYSGLGFKEQDIAWALILRPEQQFMDDLKDINDFLDGYKSINSYDSDKLNWCLINGMLHFYLMNKSRNNEIYLNKLKTKINYLIKKCE